ncbi:pancreatic progenitor cell differentiation and proliferation factor-like protein isoform X2 [Microcebus murinus]|uniref:pancreatic progenitor cell differentiation and proliferation factor-like protein isoform X2 n=1 Tax=Microcebus murinus TaxID=30608 RepID=UPI000643AE52|nr:pancreatic progenitor cell differentiation and proliferation factor-like protein isoform X3 [Microcebus murinus]
MASVPSIGCLLAKNQYYRKSSVSSVTSLTGSDSVNFVDEDKSQQEEYCEFYLIGLPEVAESTWWFKSFFHSEPVLSNVRMKGLSASGSDGVVLFLTPSLNVIGESSLCHCVARNGLGFTESTS